MVLACAGSARGQTAPQSLPVIFESDDARDGVYEAATQAAADVHIQENVPLAQLTVACGQGSTLSPYNCVNSTGFHNRYKDWVSQHPDLFEIGHHGITHTEELGTLTYAEQYDLISRSLQEMSSWGLPEGRPFAFAPPFSSEDADTITVLEQLGYHTVARNSDACLPSSAMDTFCESVSLCARDANGNRVAGPSCVFLAPDVLTQQVNDRQFDGKAFLVYHVQDLLMPDLVTVDPAKIDQLHAILHAFHDGQDLGLYRLMTYDTYFRTVRGVPTPTPLPGTDSVIYQDSLLAPWIDTSWSATVNYANTSPVLAGTRSVRVDETGWGALSVHSGSWGDTHPLDPLRYASVDVFLYTASAGFAPAVRLENDAHSSFPTVVFGTIPANQWVSVSMSMARLNPSSTPFDRVDVFDSTGANPTFYIDNFRVAGAGGPTPTPRPTATATRAVATVTPTPPPPPTATPTRTPTPSPVRPTATPIVSATPTPGGTVTPTPSPPPSTLSIYQDALSSPWINVSWSATTDFANASPVFSGSRSIRVDETGWGAFSLHDGPWTGTQPLDPARYQSVDFQVFTASTGFKISVRFENDQKTAFPEIVFGTIPANQWTHVTMPVSQLDPAGTPFDRIDVRDYTGTTRTYFIDELKLVGK